MICIVLSIVLLIYVPVKINQSDKKVKALIDYADDVEESLRKLESETLGYIWQEHRNKVRKFQKDKVGVTETLSVILVEGREHHLLEAS